MALNYDLVFGVLGLILTLAVFSYFLKDKTVFKLALNLFLGIGAGYLAAVLTLKVVAPLFRQEHFATAQAIYQTVVFLILLLLFLFNLNRRTLLIGRIPLAFMIGVIAMVTLVSIARGFLAPQLLAIFNRFSPQLLLQGSQTDWWAIVEALAMLIGVIVVLLYFDRHVSWPNGIKVRMDIGEGSSSIGEMFIGLALGAIFVGVYSSALIALLGRLDWLCKTVFAWLVH